ncbi:MAG: nucleotide pyrophosphatase/phosphodiesterase family protein [Planctomycetota bacterium]
MPDSYLIFVSMPALRTRDMQHMPRLSALAAKGTARELVPLFPCVTSSVQAAMLTGQAPSTHGIIGNGFYHRDRNEVELWIGRNNLVQSEQIWDRLKSNGISSAAWMTQNIKDAAADYIVTPEPIHHPDGRMDLWCYSKPDGLYQKLFNDLGHFPLMNYWGPMANIKSTQWIVNAALWLLQRERPRFNFIYIPHLDYAAQKFGPNSPQAADACREADEQLGRLIDGVHALSLPKVEFLVISEYAITDVSRVVYPNRMLRDAGLVATETRDGLEHLDFARSPAVAVVDHQFAHVYVKDKSDIDAVSGIFEGLDGIAHVLVGDAKKEFGIDHPRSGEVVLICEPDTWLAYYWWKDDAKAPPFARTVDIHAKPGYDPVELFFDPATKSIPLSASLVKGSHGAPAERPDQRGAIVASGPTMLPDQDSIRDYDVFEIIEKAMR